MTGAEDGAIDFTVPKALRELVEKVRMYITSEVLPAEAEISDPDDLTKSWDVVERLRTRARALQLYAPHLPPEWGGLGVGILGMSLISQELGVSELAPLGLNCMAPDEGNMHTLVQAGTKAQKERFLRPLAEGRTRSCFAMTEPDVASSDPTNLRTTAVREGDEWVLSGRKWFTTGAQGADFAIVVARTGGLGEERAATHSDYSLILVPTSTPGWEVVRQPGSIGAHSVGGHPEIALREVRVPYGNLLGGLGEGFRISQQRLAGGRLAHAMRWIGMSQRALDLTAARLLERSAFGSSLAGHQSLQFFLADSAIDLYASRLMVLHTAWKVERDVPHRQEVSMVKVFVAEAFQRILDRAVQVFGSHGLVTDEPIARWFVEARAARIYDGASEVHRMVVARNLLKLVVAGSSTKAGCGDVC